MKVCFCGLGSIGKRHVINLAAICEGLGLPLELHALRSTDRPLDKELKKYVSRAFSDISDLDSDYDIVFITNPTKMHYPSIRDMVNRCKHMFIEKPLFESPQYVLSDIDWRDGSIYYVAAPLRYKSVLRELRSIIEGETVYSARVICSSYLPDWRTGSDYRAVYSAKKSLGGGVKIDLIHEWDYITHLFGFPDLVYELSGKFSHLEIDSEDLAVYIARYPDKLVELHLDYFGRIPQRKIELYMRERVVVCDLLNNQIHLSDSGSNLQPIDAGQDMYVEELKCFMDMILKPTQSSEHSVLHHIEHAHRVLKLSTEGKL